MDRRALLKLCAYSILSKPLHINAKSLISTNRKLLLIELQGGNDGLNTLIPYRDPAYYQYRPTIAIQENSVLPLNKKIAMHPALKEIKELYDNKEMACVQGLGYCKPNRSHFRSIEIWDTASSSEIYLDQGWVHSLELKDIGSIIGVVLGGESGPLSGAKKGVITLNKLESFLNLSKNIQSHVTLVNDNRALLHILNTEVEIKKSAQVLEKYLRHKSPLPYTFKQTEFGRQMHLAAQILSSDLNIPVIKVTLGSFDTHVNQLKQQNKLLEILSENVYTLRNNLITKGKWENTLAVTYSEFGRRVKENASKGTDHGTAAPHFVLGGSVKGGIYGEMPSLKNLDANGDLVFTTDFRSLYHTIQKEWFQTGSTLLKDYPILPILKV